ncbi:hypothetical protein PIB30_064765 [Stylosanthes scabra]|uniref:Ubiquitin-like protease family profile domain-containing protein n=1 Tax=Stylosanthes scabra TaxID=79078 RepID=A0ABU6XJP7_9FABA|nr:hypothetical protein [Stylosanthes scabra]
MHSKLGEDGKNFDRHKAARKWWLIPVCNRLHWYLYAFNLDKRDLLVLDSMYDHPFDELRKLVDEYVVPKQPNNDDCGIYVIKFMKKWNEDSNLIAYTNEELVKIRKTLVLDIVLSNYNTIRGLLLQKAFTVSKRRNNPNRDKKKEVRSPFTAPSTNEITIRAEKRNVEGKEKQ